MVLHSKLRSWLTILGIVIGVASVIAIMSIGAGLQESVNSQLGALGNDILTVTAGFSRAGGFGGFNRGGGGGGGGEGGSAIATATDKQIILARTDLQAVKSLPDVLRVNTNIRGNVDAYYLAKKGSVSVTGIDPSVWSQITTKTITDGRMLGPSDTNVILIGGRIATTFFNTPVGINQQITINGRLFRIVGILNDESNNVIMPIDMAYQVLDDKTVGVYDSFEIKIKDENELDLAIANIDQKLMNIRHVTAKNKDFSISSPKEQAQRFADLSSSLTLFLTAIAAVALLVGAVGIANTMFTSVLEKTKEIGIMKAVGARNKDILTIFLLNSILIGFLGGILGVALGYILSGFVPALLGGSGVTGRLASGGTIVTMQSVILALSISVGIGMVSGVIPAYQASKLKPVDALRYE